MSKYALNIAEDGRILSATFERFAPEAAVLVDALPTGETELEQDIHNWLYRDGGYVYAPLPETSEPEVQPTNEERIADLEEALYLFLSGVTE